MHTSTQHIASQREMSCPTQGVATLPALLSNTRYPKARTEQTQKGNKCANFYVIA